MSKLITTPRVILFVGLTLLCLSTGVVAQRITYSDAKRIVWRIDAPPVTSPKTDYPSVRFQPLDEVIVEAGGCAQTGGHGDTWKRYVNPSGQNSDRLYHGRISIPGATAGLVRISSITGPYQAQPLRLVVNKLPAHYDGSALYLQLGYEDDNYSDNGYSGHDDGTGGQCRSDRDGGNAWIVITIIHHDATNPAPPTPTPKAPLDLWWAGVDENFLPLNPAWWYQRTNNGALQFANQLCNDFHNEGDALPSGKSPACTTWDPDVDERGTLALCAPKIGTVAGHINWAAVTYTGRIFFHEYSGNLPQDNDYNLALLTPPVFPSAPDNLSGVTVPTDIKFEDKFALLLEFDSGETVDRMNGLATWWDTLHHAADSGGAAARRLLRGQEVIAIGLLGLDHQHDAKAELHPVYGLAIHVEDTPDRDVWAVFARNWGNEGACSNRAPTDHNLRLRNNQMTFFIPKPANASVAGVTGSFKASYPNVVQNSRVVDDGTLLTISLPEPEARGIFWGELVIKKRR